MEQNQAHELETERDHRWGRAPRSEVPSLRPQPVARGLPPADGDHAPVLVGQLLEDLAAQVHVGLPGEGGVEAGQKGGAVCAGQGGQLSAAHKTGDEREGAHAHADPGHPQKGGQQPDTAHKPERTMSPQHLSQQAENRTQQAGTCSQPNRRMRACVCGGGYLLKGSARAEAKPSAGAPSCQRVSHVH